MKFFMAIAVVAFCGPMTGIAKEATQFEETSLEDAMQLEDLLAENRAGLKAPLKITENPIKYLRILVEKPGPITKYETQESQTNKKSKSVLSKVIKENSQTFNQEINLSAQFGGVSASSTTSFGFEKSTSTEDSSAQALVTEMTKADKETYTIKADEVYLEMAVINIYVVKQNEKRIYVQIPKPKLVTGVKKITFLQKYIKDHSFEDIFVGNLTMYTVKEMVDAMPENLIKTVKTDMGLPDPKKSYYIESDLWVNIALEAWARGEQDVGCLPNTRIDNYMKTTKGFPTKHYKQWKFIPVSKNGHKTGYYYIKNRQFGNVLYYDSNSGSWGARTLPTNGRKDEYQWKVRTRNSNNLGSTAYTTVTIESKKTLKKLSTWSQVVGNNLEHYNCGPLSNFMVVKNVSDLWDKFWDFDAGMWQYTTYTTADMFFSGNMNRFAKLVIGTRKGSPTRSRDKNIKMFKKIDDFKSATRQKPIDKETLWKLKEVKEEFSPAFLLSPDASKLLKNIGEGAFNAGFKKCPVVLGLRGVYVRTSPVPSTFNAFDVFTGTWASKNNVINKDFKLYSNIEDAKINSWNSWNYCNYDVQGAGFPLDCGVNGWTGGNRFFAMPGSKYSGNLDKNDNGIELWTGSDCPSTQSG